MSSQTRRLQGQTRARPLRVLAGGMLVAGLLAGCDGEGNFAFPAANSGSGQMAAAPGTTIERDVEAPEVFSVTDAGLWDGRPSLGGVWVAHPDVTEPERVIIRNQSNDTFVVGALFRRERDIPGPSLQISSDAAASLGILAGAPAQLNVTALRRIEEAETAADQATDDAPTAVQAPPDVATATLDPVTAGAGAAIDAAPATTPTATTPSATSTAAAAPQPPAPAAIPVQASRLSKPFVQIGIFSIEANAERAAKQMRGAGLAPTVKQSQISGNTFWRVVVGPAANSAELDKIMSSIKAEGFTDAYAVSN